MISECRDAREIDRIVEDYIDTLNPFNRKFFCKWANSAKKRITRVNREFRKHYNLN
jgi:hypothetical protein